MIGQMFFHVAGNRKFVIRLNFAKNMYAILIRDDQILPSKPSYRPVPMTP